MCKMGRRPDVATMHWMMCLLHNYLRGYKYMNRGVGLELQENVIRFRSGSKMFLITVEEI